MGTQGNPPPGKNAAAAVAGALSRRRLGIEWIRVESAAPAPARARPVNWDFLMVPANQVQRQLEADWLRLYRSIELIVGLEALEQIHDHWIATHPSRCRDECE